MTRIENIPNELKQLTTWACYQKATKMLVSAINGIVIQSDDFISLTDYQTAYEYYATHKESIDGIAFVLPPQNEYLIIGLQKANQDVVKEWVEGINSYCENSINSESINIICRARLKDSQKISSYGIELDRKYLCLTGDKIQGYDTIQSSSQNAFDKLYDKYFKGINRSVVSYSFNSKNKNKTALTKDDVVRRIQNSIASNKYYILMGGDYRNANFSEENDAIMGLLAILIFFTGGDKALTLKIFKESKLYNKDKFNAKINDTTLGEILYQQADKRQQKVYVEGEYNERDFVFDNDTCAFKYFKEYSKDDTGNAQRVFDKYHDILKYDVKQTTFYIYNENLGIWQAETKENIRVRRMVDSVLDDMKVEMTTPRVKGDDKEYIAYMKNFQYLSSTKGKEHCIADLKTKSGLECYTNDFDSDYFLLNTRSGVVNLKNGQLLEHKKEFMMTKSTNCEIDFTNKPTKFLKFVKEICCGDEELMHYLQRIAGYCLTGSIEEQEYYFFQGDGNDGKSVFSDMLMSMLGDYAINVQIDTFLQQRFKDGSRASPDKARMKGARLVITNEPDGNAVIDESFIKQLTGEDIITARELHKEPFQFKAQCKLIILCNNLMKITGTTRGDWRRPKIVEFKNSVPEELIDKHLREKLRSELPQILAWALTGCLEWQRKGMQTPKFVKDAVSDYRTESNVVFKYFNEVVEITGSANDYVFASDLFIHFNRWRRAVGEPVELSQTKFGKEIIRYQKLNNVFMDKTRTTNGKIIYRGIKLMSLDNSEENVLREDLKNPQEYHFSSDLEGE